MAVFSQEMVGIIGTILVAGMLTVMVVVGIPTKGTIMINTTNVKELMLEVNSISFSVFKLHILHAFKNNLIFR